MMYDYVFSTMGSSTKVKIEYIVRVVQEKLIVMIDLVYLQAKSLLIGLIMLTAKG